VKPKIQQRNRVQNYHKMNGQERINLDHILIVQGKEKYAVLFAVPRYLESCIDVRGGSMYRAGMVFQ
jgi:hypothetical protein